MSDEVNAGRSGSFTQFIFRSDLCCCEQPGVAVEERQAVGPADQELDRKVRDEEDELDLDESVFPGERYRPLMELGSGASASVYLARDRILDKLVVVKQLRPMRAQDSVAFNEEARILSRLEHPGIVRVLDFGISPGGFPYMVLEHDPGRTLAAYLAEHGPISWEIARSWFAELASTLAYAHQRGVFHRDIKPANLLGFLISVWLWRAMRPWSVLQLICHRKWLTVSASMSALRSIRWVVFFSSA